MTKAVFLDRDGVINERAAEHDYIKTWDSFVLLNGVKEAIASLNKRGYLVFIVSNQQGIARGKFTLEALDDIHEKLKAKLLKYGAKIDDISVCPHSETENCECRKPKTKMFEDLMNKYEIDMSNSYMVGDSESDIIAGKNSGLKTIYVGGKNSNADYSAANLYNAAFDIILK